MKTEKDIQDLQAWLYAWLGNGHAGFSQGTCRRLATDLLVAGWRLGSEPPSEENVQALKKAIEGYEWWEATSLNLAQWLDRCGVVARVSRVSPPTDTKAPK